MYLLDEKLKKKTRIEKKVMFCHFYAKFSFRLLGFKSYGRKNFLEEMIEAKLHCCRPAQKLVCCIYTAKTAFLQISMQFILTICFDLIHSKSCLS